jgi:hypothetical protein
MFPRVDMFICVGQTDNSYVQQWTATHPNTADNVRYLIVFGYGLQKTVKRILNSKRQTSKDVMSYVMLWEVSLLLH